MAGLRRAKAKAILLSDQLDRDKFTWDDWSDISNDEPELKTCGYWIERFKAHVLPDLPEPKERTWRRRFLYFGLNKLPLDAHLTPEILIAAVLTKPKNKKAARDRACAQLQRLADFAGIDINLKPYKAGYNQSDIEERYIPDDLEIQTIIDGIHDPNWRQIFGLMATYGLRDHEAFLCTLEDREGALVANVPENTKTGQRIAYPHPVEWVERWNLNTGKLPWVKVASNEDYGQRCAQQWRKLTDTEATPYCLRHAYSIRCHTGGTPTAIAAKWMGHSSETNRKAYQRWISESVNRAEWEKLNGVDQCVD
ncbi:hypothetical protein D0962_15415 [Leptolyngbyaceae cyanobacterium CCMR0082]|uniref:Tyr recombinase domain-containing protein n=1 Tax=Adonisia turfae CCMR0082 TaxID=2304604 RepID=A0A6M0S8M8_9CYAN|nr:hypothetical protein [Adonisia turfae]NEZ64162.1 hypothetical protein [Adonisia turfae CCMR0082]